MWPSHTKWVNLTPSGARSSVSSLTWPRAPIRHHIHTFNLFFLPGNSLKLSLRFLLHSLAKPQHKQQRPYQAPAANTSAEQRIYLNLPLALEVLRGPRQGASPTCLRIHSHLRIKFLTLMLLVMLGAAPVFKPCRSTATLNMFRSEKRTTVLALI